MDEKDPEHAPLVFADGVDNISYLKLPNLLRSAQQGGVVIYTVGLLAAENRSTARDARRQSVSLAEATGEEAFISLNFR